MCRILGISRASYYKWVHYQPSELELENEQLKREIESIYHKYNGIYGYRRIYIYIRLKLGKQVNRKRIYCLMKELNLKAVIRQKRNLIDVQRHKSHQKISLIDNLTLIRQIKFG